MCKTRFLHGLLLLALTMPVQAGIVVSINPAVPQVNAGEMIDMAIDISGLDNALSLAAYDLSISFEPSLLEFSSAGIGDPLLGDQLDLAQSGLNFPLVSTGPGLVNLLEFSLDDSAILKAQQTGHFRLATLSFIALAEGNSLLTLTANNLADADANSLFADVSNASVNIVGISPHQIPEPAGNLLICLGGLVWLLTRLLKHLAAIFQMYINLPGNHSPKNAARKNRTINLKLYLHLLGLFLVFGLGSSGAKAAGFLAAPNTQVKVAGWGCYYIATGESAGAGSFTVTTQPKHGVISYGSGLSGFVTNGKRVPVTIAYYTWTDTQANADQDTFALHWDANVSGCSVNDSIQIQKIASPRNSGKADPDCPKTCDGNPMNAGTGNKFQVETDFAGLANSGLEIQRFYNSLDSTETAFGIGWRGTWQQSLSVLNSNALRVIRADGRVENFNKNTAGVWQADPDVSSRLSPIISANNQQSGWQLLTGDDSTEIYTLDGRLVSVKNRTGLVTTLSYDSNDRLTTVTGHFGQTLSLSYFTSGLLASIQLPDGGVLSYTYGANKNLVSVTHPDKTVRQYWYENSAFPHALTGITDENAKRFATWSYDAKGRVTSSQHAGGVELTTIAYNPDGSSTVTDALGNQHSYNFITQFDVVKPTDVSGTAVKSLGAKAFTYDANGFVASKTDFNNTVTTYTHDARGLELSRTEAAGTPLARTITTSWHATLRLPVKITGPNRAITFAYDAAGNLTQRTVTDGKQSRTWTYIYNAIGQVLSVDGPRTDVNDITHYSYDSKGNLSSVTNALGQTRKLSAYDANGHPLKLEDANGLTSTFSYDARGRLRSVQVGDETTSYQRDAVGQVVKVTAPDGSFTSMVYDDAHRLVKISDQLGNFVKYSLDAVGNKLKEDTYDPKANLTKTLSSQFDALNRLTASVGAEGQKASYEYDANDNLLSISDPLHNKTSLSYDALNRLIGSMDATGNTSKTVYDVNDQVVSVTDPLNHKTTYDFDGLGNALTINSPDTGISESGYDNAGNQLTGTDARGQTATYRYDALNRLSQIQYADGEVINLLYDHGTNGIGRLAQISDIHGATRWAYDLHGRVSSKTFTTGPLSLVTRYTYDGNGRLSSMTYPSGQVLEVAYDQGVVSALANNGQALLTDIRYQPFGAPSEWVFGNGIKTVRDFDLDGRLIGYDLGNRARQLAYDAAGRIVSYQDTDMNYDQHFVYDELNRLTRFTTPALHTDYSYDANANRSRVIANDKTVSPLLDTASNRLLGLSQNNLALKTYSYDASGNIISDGQNHFSYDGRGRLVQASGSFGQETYRINGLGQRIAKVTGKAVDLSGDANQDGTVSATDLRLLVLMAQGSVPVNLAGDCNHDGKITSTDATCTQTKIADLRLDPNKYIQPGTYFVYDEAGHLIGEYNQAGKAIQETVWLGNMPVAVMSGSQRYFIYTDHLNAPKAIADSLAKVVWRWDADAFGTTAANEDADQDGKPFTYNLRFPGQYYDKSTGLHYNGFRDYDPETGRYLESDPIGLNGGLNTYGYVSANSINLVDSLGLASTEDQIQLGMDSTGVITGLAVRPDGSYYNFIRDRYYSDRFWGNQYISSSSVVQAKGIANTLSNTSSALSFVSFSMSVNKYCEDPSAENTIGLALSTAGLVPQASYSTGMVQVGMGLGKITKLDYVLGAASILIRYGFNDKSLQIISDGMSISGEW